MKLLVVLGSDETYYHIAHYVKPLGFDLIRYSHVVKAMDNVSEIDPAGIVLSARDYPRHWKTLVQFIRGSRSKEDCPIILLTGENFSIENTSKALYLGVNGMVPENLKESAEISRLQNILGRYLSMEERRQSHRFFIEPWQRCGLLFVNPLKRVLISGKIKTLSVGGISFIPDQQVLIGDLYPDTNIPECSLRIGDEILSPECRLVRTGRIIALKFVSFPGEEQALLNSYLERLPLMELHRNTGGDTLGDTPGGSSSPAWD
ncbi:MAG: PilZ domain-containing protein [Spirochaetaceae bacterium]|jgi:hypothetical protein|nr:PilZ domain-containing protein [Spirochaetaceae bacterium]